MTSTMNFNASNNELSGDVTINFTQNLVGKDVYVNYYSATEGEEYDYSNDAPFFMYSEEATIGNSNSITISTVKELTSQYDNTTTNFYVDYVIIEYYDDQEESTFWTNAIPIKRLYNAEIDEAVPFNKQQNTVFLANISGTAMYVGDGEGNEYIDLNISLESPINGYFEGAPNLSTYADDYENADYSNCLVKIIFSHYDYNEDSYVDIIKYFVSEANNGAYEVNERIFINDDFPIPDNCYAQCLGSDKIARTRAMNISIMGLEH